MSENSEPLKRQLYGYDLVIVASRSDQTYHDRASVRVEVRREGSDDVLYVVERSTRGTHQLSKRYRPATDPTSDAVADAERWLLENRPDAAARWEAAREATRQANRALQRQKFEEVGRDPMAFILATGVTASTTEAGKILGLGSARKLNTLLVEWGLQRRKYDAYEPVDPAYGEQVGLYGTLRWEIVGLKAIWDAAMENGAVTGGDAEFIRRMRASTDWFDGIDT